MRDVLKNGAIGAAVSSVLFIVLLALKHSDISVPYIALALGLSLAAAFSYGFIAIRLHIYGRGSNTTEKWKNGVVGCLILALEASLYAILSFSIPPEVFVCAVASSGIAIAISDAIA